MHVIRSGAAGVAPADALLEKLRSGRQLVAKLGVDPTAPDLHLGHAVPLRKLRQFQDLGHKVVLIIGDFTALIGDPSGRNTTRPALTGEEIEVNAQTYIEQAFRILDPDATEMRRNSEWLSPLGFADVLRLTSRFTIARILERDDFQKRYREGVGISLHEFLYPVAQAYDSVAVRADVEIGGTDQLFNLLAGRELMEKLGLEPQVCLTLPLLEGTDGVQKMSKTYGNYIGLTDEPDDMFGKVMSIPDELTVKYFRLATSVPVGEVDAIEAALVSGEAHPGEVKRRLAREIVALYHGQKAADSAEEAFDRVFKRHEAPEEMRSHVLAEETVYLPKVLEDLGFATSRSESRRLIDQGGVRIDGRPVTMYGGDRAAFVGVLQVGRRHWARLVLPRSET
ncbi:MAG: tyrosine--tRNA ligase [Coriobacteriia bacterium]|nr:tyrosine--tRNA ligase [Coriobacteriia bacterium]